MWHAIHENWRHATWRIPRRSLVWLGGYGDAWEGHQIGASGEIQGYFWLAPWPSVDTVRPFPVDEVQPQLTHDNRGAVAHSFYRKHHNPPE